MFFQGKKIVLGITAGVALYAMCDFIRRLRGEGAEVRIILTENAARLISPQVFHAVSGIPPGMTDGAFPHLDFIRDADAFLVAPATANILGKAANGIADDLLSTTLLAAHGIPIFFAPAMNTRMWKNPMVQENCHKLRAAGYGIIDPCEGSLACGDVGEGRMVHPDRLFHAMVRAVTPSDLVGRKILITAGSTRESLDPVRFLSNYGSGKMGYFLAQNAWHRGADVTIISGPVAYHVSVLLRGMPEVKIISVTTASEMYLAAKRFFSSCDACIFSAAVSDFRPVSFSRSKLKKSMTFRPIFTHTVDIAEKLSCAKTHQKVIGFSLETDAPIANARKKLQAKHFDMIVANTPETFGSDEIHGAFVTLKKQIPFQRCSKYSVASKIFDFVLK